MEPLLAFTLLLTHSPTVAASLCGDVAVVVAAMSSRDSAGSDTLSNNDNTSENLGSHSNSEKYAADDSHIQCNQPAPTQPSSSNPSYATSKQDQAKGTVAGIVIAVVISFTLALLIICLWRRKSKLKNVEQEEMAHVDRRLFHESSVRPHLTVGVAAAVPRVVPLRTNTSSCRNSTASSCHSLHPSRTSNLEFGSVDINPLAKTDDALSSRCSSAPILPPALPSYERHSHSSVLHNSVQTPHTSLAAMSEAEQPIVQSPTAAVSANSASSRETGTTVCLTTTSRSSMPQKDLEIDVRDKADPPTPLPPPSYSMTRVSLD